MRIEQLTKKKKQEMPNMDYCINFNGTRQYFSKSAILELQSKLNEFFIGAVVGQGEQFVCEECKEPMVEPYAERYGKKFCLGCM